MKFKILFWILAILAFCIGPVLAHFSLMPVRTINVSCYQEGSDELNIEIVKYAQQRKQFMMQVLNITSSMQDSMREGIEGIKSVPKENVKDRDKYESDLDRVILGFDEEIMIAESLINGLVKQTSSWVQVSPGCWSLTPPTGE